MLVRVSNSNWIVYLILIFIPFIQLGISYYESVFFVVFLVSFTFSIKVCLSNNRFFYFSLMFMTFIFLLKFVLLLFSNSSFREALIPMREFLCMISIYIISVRIKDVKYLNYKFLSKLILIILVAILIIVCFQLFYFSYGIYVGLPQDWFVINQGTLAGAEQAFYFGTRFRPVSFYGEPSYTGWVVVSLLTVVLSRSEFVFRFKYLIIALSFGIVILSQAFSGILAVSILVFYWYLLSFNKNKYLLLFSVTLIFLLFFALLFNYSEEFQRRIIGISSSEDISFNVRVLEPFEQLNAMISAGEFFGVYNFSDLGVDNAALGLVLMYGISSFFILFLLYFYINNNFVFLYLLLSLNFNGAFLRFDKVLLFALVIGLCYQSIFSKKVVYVS